MLPCDLTSLRISSTSVPVTLNVIGTLLISHAGCDPEEHMICQVCSPFEKNPTQSDLSNMEDILALRTQRSRHVSIEIVHTWPWDMPPYLNSAFLHASLPGDSFHTGAKISPSASGSATPAEGAVPFPVTSINILGRVHVSPAQATCPLLRQSLRQGVTQDSLTYPAHCKARGRKGQPR